MNIKSVKSENNQSGLGKELIGTLLLIVLIFAMVLVCIFVPIKVGTLIAVLLVFGFIAFYVIKKFFW